MVTSRLNGQPGAAASRSGTCHIGVRQSCRQGEPDGTHDHCHPAKRVFQIRYQNLRPAQFTARHLNASSSYRSSPTGLRAVSSCRPVADHVTRPASWRGSVMNVRLIAEQPAPTTNAGTTPLSRQWCVRRSKSLAYKTRMHRIRTMPFANGNSWCRSAPPPLTDARCMRHAWLYSGEHPLLSLFHFSSLTTHKSSVQLYVPRCFNKTFIMPLGESRCLRFSPRIRKFPPASKMQLKQR